MKDSDLTPWFSGDVKPVRPGVYERNCYGFNHPYRWDGKAWRYQLGRCRSRYQDIPWRGLTKEAHDRMKREGK